VRTSKRTKTYQFCKNQTTINNYQESVLKDVRGVLLIACSATQELAIVRWGGKQMLEIVPWGATQVPPIVDWATEWKSPPELVQTIS